MERKIKDLVSMMEEPEDTGYSGTDDFDEMESYNPEDGEEEFGDGDNMSYDDEEEEEPL